MNIYEQLNTIHFFLGQTSFFTCTYVMPAAEGIKPSALQLWAQRLATEQSARAIYIFRVVIKMYSEYKTFSVNLLIFLRKLIFRDSSRIK